MTKKELGKESHQLSLSCTGKNKQPTVGCEPTTTGVQNQSHKNITPGKTKTCETAKK